MWSLISINSFNAKWLHYRVNIIRVNLPTNANDAPNSINREKKKKTISTCFKSISTAPLKAKNQSTTCVYFRRLLGTFCLSFTRVMAIEIRHRQPQSKTLTGQGYKHIHLLNVCGIRLLAGSRLDRDIGLPHQYTRQKRTQTHVHTHPHSPTRTRRRPHMHAHARKNARTRARRCCCGR